MHVRNGARVAFDNLEETTKHETWIRTSCNKLFQNASNKTIVSDFVFLLISRRDMRK